MTMPDPVTLTDEQAARLFEAALDRIEQLSADPDVASVEVHPAVLRALALEIRHLWAELDRLLAILHVRKRLAAEISSLGGKARAEALTPERRQQIARTAVNARWRKHKSTGPTPEESDHA
jgi:hypothetical protein